MGTKPPPVATRMTTSAGPVGWEMAPAGSVVEDEPGLEVEVVSESPPPGGLSMVPQAAAPKVRTRTATAAKAPRAIDGRDMWDLPPLKCTPRTYSARARVPACRKRVSPAPYWGCYSAPHDTDDGHCARLGAGGSRGGRWPLCGGRGEPPLARLA